MQETKGKHGRGAAISTAAAVLLIPLTIAAGQFFPGSRKYYIISLLIILYLMLPFFAAFESRRPQPRELVIIAVMCAVAIGGRLAFFWLPQFKPMTAVVILSGIAFGRQTGFLTGAVTAFVSNFYFGQGPWTPWQMFALGLTGLISGLILKRDYVPRRALPCIFPRGRLDNTARVLPAPPAQKPARKIEAGNALLPAAPSAYLSI